MDVEALPRNPHTPSGAETRSRLIEAAGGVFAARGFRAATIREICSAAGVNLAAVGYHFGDKQGLYLEVLRYAHQRCVERYPPLLSVAPDAAPEERLRAFVQSLLLRTLGEGRPAWHGRLLSREMLDPTPALAVLIDEAFRPVTRLLEGIVGELLGPAATAYEVRRAAESVLGQCLFYQHAERVLQVLHPEDEYGSGAVDALAEHLTRFTLAALGGLAAHTTETDP